jgi:hypothetical protein
MNFKSCTQMSSTSLCARWSPMLHAVINLHVYFFLLLTEKKITSSYNYKLSTRNSKLISQTYPYTSHGIGKIPWSGYPQQEFEHSYWFKSLWVYTLKIEPTQNDETYIDFIQ